MPEQQDPNQQIQFLLADFNTRLRDSEERNKLLKDRALLLGKNLIAIKEEQGQEIQNLKTQTSKIQREVEALKKLTKSILTETDKFVRRDEILVIERMLKDFQPLEFAREKDVKALISQALKPKPANPITITKTIKTKKTKK